MRHVNSLVTMVLCGCWHGVGWNFAIWGAIHGLLLSINHLWRQVHPSRRASSGPERWWSVLPKRLLTFSCVSVAWVFFASPSLHGSLFLLSAMAGHDGLSLPRTLAPLAGPFAVPAGMIGISFDGFFRGFVPSLRPHFALIVVALGIFISAVGPNTQEWLGLQRRTDSSLSWFSWKPCFSLGVLLGLLLFLLLRASVATAPSPFVYGGF